MWRAFYRRSTDVYGSFRLGNRNAIAAGGRELAKRPMAEDVPFRSEKGYRDRVEYVGLEQRKRKSKLCPVDDGLSPALYWHDVHQKEIG